MIQTRIPENQIVPLGQELYNTKIGPVVETEENIGKFISIDVETGEYEISDEILEPAFSILTRRPDAILYGARIGYDATFAVGGGVINRTPSLKEKAS